MNYGLKKPIPVLVDSDFAITCAREGIQIKFDLGGFLNDETYQPFITQCSFKDLDARMERHENIRKARYDMSKVRRYDCGHSSSPMRSTDCVLDVLSKENECAVVGVIKDDLKAQIRKIPGVCTLLVHNNVIIVEEISRASIEKSHKNVLASIKPKKEQLERIEKIVKGLPLNTEEKGATKKEDTQEEAVPQEEVAPEEKAKELEEGESPKTSEPTKKKKKVKQQPKKRKRAPDEQPKGEKKKRVRHRKKKEKKETEDGEDQQNANEEESNEGNLKEGEVNEVESGADTEPTAQKKRKVESEEDAI
eukprot:TRINITY_DN3313_c0_g1_i1.p1 TRINITY_DN3313_c0_g1~~TRINITY_DN3313_c0_g1_i1.p1  ORF type:complete len:331 (+),score=94.48 TRINITY_DN3313_c0_g1_i1:76-993(+)